MTGASIHTHADQVLICLLRSAIIADDKIGHSLIFLLLNMT